MDVQRYSQATFNQMVYELHKYLKEIGYSLDDVQIIPVSGAEVNGREFLAYSDDNNNNNNNKNNNNILRFHVSGRKHH